MDFSWSDEQLEFRNAVLEFAQKELNEGLLERDEEGRFDRELWQKCATFGLQGLPVPEEYGGQGADPLTIMLAMEALGQGCKDNGLLFSLNAHMWATIMPILRFGSDEQKQRYLPGLVDGTLIGAHGMTEPGSGSDAFALRTRVDKRGDDVVLNGSKIFITNAPIAEVFIIFATSDPAKGAFGLSAFLVDRDTPGMTVAKPFKKMGLKTSPMSEVVFDDCVIPAGNVLNRMGNGMAIFNHSMEWERACILASAVGTMERQIEDAVAYANQREQFGQPIAKYQAVSHRIADMKVRLEAARLLLYKTGWAMENQRSAVNEAAMAKLVISEAWVQSSLDAIQVHGGYGYMAEYDVERDLRDAVGSRLYSGTSEIQKNLIARALGLST